MVLPRCGGGDERVGDGRARDVVSVAADLGVNFMDLGAASAEPGGEVEVVPWAGKDDEN